MNKKQAVKNLQKVYKEDLEEIIKMIEESKDDYNSLYELRLDINEELEFMRGYIKNFFSYILLNYFDYQTNKIYFKEANSKMPIKKVFSKVDFETTEFLLRDYTELKEIMKKEEEKQDKKLNDYFIKLQEKTYTTDQITSMYADNDNEFLDIEFNNEDILRINYKDLPNDEILITDDAPTQEDLEKMLQDGEWQ